jgi:hypothetical protein
MGFDLLIAGVVAQFGGAYGPSGASFGISTYGSRILCNVSGSALVRSVDLRVTTDTGTGTWFGGSNNVRYLIIEDIGASLPGFTSIT